jgi:hypothetical protein
VNTFLAVLSQRESYFADDLLTQLALAQKTLASAEDQALMAHGWSNENERVSWFAPSTLSQRAEHASQFL